MGVPKAKFGPGNSPGRLRGKGVTEFIGKQTRNGLELAEYFLRVLRGHEKGATPAHKAAAAMWLADRYMGKAVDVTLTGDIDGVNNPLADVSSTELRALIKSAHDNNVIVTMPNVSVPENSARETPGEPPAPPAAPSESTPPDSAPPPNPKPYSEAPKCTSCGLRRAHNLDCPERVKPG